MPDDTAPATGAAGVPWAAIRDSLFAAAKVQIEARAKGFLDDHHEARALLTRWTEDLGRAVFFYAIATDNDRKADLQAQMDALRSAIKEESLSILVDAEPVGKTTFMAIVETVLEVGVKVLPLLLAL